MSRICIDLGHGVGQDRGSVGIVHEENIINEVGTKVINKLRALGHEVILSRPSRATTLVNSLAQRVNTANNHNCDIFVSIHANATPGGYGTEIYTYNGVRHAEAVNILKNITSLGFKDRGIKPSNNVAYVVNHTSMKAMLIELFFIDSKSDVNLYYKVGSEAVADAVVKGLVGTTVQAIVSDKKVTVNKNISTHLRDWQEAYNRVYRTNIFVDGIRGQQVENAMSKAILKLGSNNDLVGWLQCRLHIIIDNDFGQNTLAAVKNFQRENNLVVDGVVGYNTWNVLLRKYNW